MKRKLADSQSVDPVLAKITRDKAMVAAQDPVSKIPEYKVCAVRLRKENAR